MILVVEFFAGVIVGMALLGMHQQHMPPQSPPRESATKELIRQRLYASGWRPEQ